MESPAILRDFFIFILMTIEAIYQLFDPSIGISTDTRNINDGQLFFALKGANFNGNLYAEQAINSGASYAIIDEKEYQVNDQCILVDDVLTCLQDLAHHHRMQFDIPVIGITGSNGKTTSKELIHAGLSAQYKVHYTKGNFNNHIGVPLTLLAMQRDTEIAIIEMGANHMNEIEALSKIAHPNYGIITNCGKAHIEGFGSEENIKIGKGELYQHIKNNGGQLFVNEEIDYLMDMSEGIDRITYSNLEVKSSNPLLSLEAEGKTFNVQLLGRYNVANISGAFHISKHFNIDTDRILKALSAYEPDGLNRSELKDYKGAKIIMDAYNANPSSMNAALESFHQDEYDSKTVILGDMFELGDTSNQEHQNIISKLSELNFDTKVVVGSLFKKNANDSVIAFETTEEVKAWFDQQKLEGKAILIKGSRGMKLESLISG